MIRMTWDVRMLFAQLGIAQSTGSFEYWIEIIFEFVHCKDSK